jgi:hypothetical protein
MCCGLVFYGLVFGMGKGDMTMNIIYQSVKFNEKDIAKRYFRKYFNGEVKFFDVNVKDKTIREYWLNEVDCDFAVKNAGYGETIKL